MAENLKKGLNVIWEAMVESMRGFMSVSSYNVVLLILHLYRNKNLRNVLEEMADKPYDSSRLISDVQNEVNAESAGQLNYLIEVIPVFEHELSELCKVKGAFRHLINAFSSISDELYQSQFGELFDSLLDRIAISSGKTSGVFIRLCR